MKILENIFHITIYSFGNLRHQFGILLRWIIPVAKSISFHQRHIDQYKKVTKNTPVKQDNRFKDSRLGFIPVPFPAEFVQGIDKAS
jgi:hypothetical protein